MLGAAVVARLPATGSRAVRSGPVNDEIPGPGQDPHRTGEPELGRAEPEWDPTDWGPSRPAARGRRRAVPAGVACRSCSASSSRSSAVVVAAGAIWFLGRDGDSDRLRGPEAADALVEAYTRNIDATFLVEGELTRTLDDGRSLSSAYLQVQRPPDHIQRALGSTTGDLGGRTVNCSTPLAGATPVPPAGRRRTGPSSARPPSTPSTPTFGVTTPSTT